MSTDELVRWMIDVDRRLIAIKAFKDRPAVKASEVAESSGRSIQNISHALNEMEEKGLVEGVMPDKHSWRKYMLTVEGHNILEELEKRKLLI